MTAGSFALSEQYAAANVENVGPAIEMRHIALYHVPCVLHHVAAIQ